MRPWREAGVGLHVLPARWKCPPNCLSRAGFVFPVEELDGGKEESTVMICIQRSVDHVREDCFYFCRSLAAVAFESDSLLSSSAESPFSGWSTVSSICVPSSVERLCNSCFY
jgi:hypothetical protein